MIILLLRERKSVSLKFDSRFSTTTILKKQTAIHECIASNISSQLDTLMGSSAASSMLLLGDTKLRTPLSTKTKMTSKLSNPDLQMLWATPTTPLSPVLFVEVGFSQPTDILESKTMDLLRGSKARVAIVIDVKERPMYKNPFKKQKNIDHFKSQFKRVSPADDLELFDHSNMGSRPFDPVTLFNVCWVGELSASVQVFAKDAGGDIIKKTEKMVSQVTLRFLVILLMVKLFGFKTFFGDFTQQKKATKGNSLPDTVFSESPNLNTKLSDFLPESAEAPDQELTIDWGLQRKKLDMARLPLAQERCLTGIEELRKKGHLDFDFHV